MNRPGLLAERQQLRAELERINAEIHALKGINRSVRDDYRLRARMADAEALARRLTDLDSRLNGQGSSGGPRPISAGQTPVRGLGAEPGAAPTDGPAELEAKADILADQSRRLASQAELMQQRVGQLRGRQELRRRAGQLEQDPFSPLEGSKRRTVTGSRGGDRVTAGAAQDDKAGAPGVGSGGAPANIPTTPTVTGDRTGGGAGPPTTQPTSTGTPTAIPESTSRVDTQGAAPTRSPTPSPTTFTADPAASVSSRLRELLDPGTLAEIRRLEAGGAPGSDLRALERAVEALRAKSQRLDTQSRNLREKAKSNR
jgi:hypothetical protein